MEIGAELNEILTRDKTLIHINLGFGPEGFFDVNRSVVISWGVIAVLFLLCVFLTRNMKVHGPGKRQLVAELAVVKLRGMIEGLTGHGGKPYVDFIVTVMIYIAGCNLVGLFGLIPPTMDLNVTAALAFTAIVMVEFAAIRHKSFKGRLKAFAEPIAVITPMNIMELGIRPLSLCMRLFGNILGATVIMELLKMVIPVGLPALFSIYFDLFDGLIQAYVFVFLTSLYLSEATE